MPDLLRHLQGLDGHEAGPYIQAAARGYSHQVWQEEYRACLLGRWPWVIVLGLALAGGGTAAGWRPDVALPLTLLAAVSMLARAMGLLNLGRLFSWRTGKNLVAVIPSADTLRHRVVLVARYDMAQVPQRLRWLTTDRERWLLRATGVAVLLMPALVTMRLFGVNYAGWGLAFCLLVVGTGALLLFLRELSARPEGRRPENVGGVAAALLLGEELAQAPLQHTEVWTVFTGCPGGGLHALLDRYGQLLADAHLITLAGTSPGPVRYLPQQGELARIAQAAAAARPEWGIRPAGVPVPGTEVHAALRRGVSALALTGGTGHGELLTLARFAGNLLACIDRAQA